ncbi:UrcA family protein [Maricaulis sp.]|jgi:UrcA family protein|uniref:UrcA family protein n=1 Tax=Maricaulis sp. TaxID=1486257 RepID=UPI00261B39EB|nr:UrcA family protein [Maricaulis sp.]
MFRSTLSAALAALALSAAPALAGSPFTVRIPVIEADLADPARLEALEARIAQAAQDVCRERVTGDLLRAYTLRSCIETTTAHAMEQLEARLAEAPAPERSTASRED